MTRGAVARPCRCAPNQWEAMLNTVDREIDWTEGAMMQRESMTRVHYDYNNRLFATVELDSGIKSIVDYNKGVKYSINIGINAQDVSGECQTSPVHSAMVRMCLPDNARMLNEFRAGVDVPVSDWLVNLPGNGTLRTTVLKKYCMPLTEETYMATSDYVSMVSSMYVNVSFGIRDPSVFQPPEDCT